MPESFVPQMELAGRATGQIRRLRIGLIASVVAVAAALVASFSFVAWTSAGQTWPIVVVVGQILIAGVCLLQWWIWVQARANWEGHWSGQLNGLISTSVVAHVVSWGFVAMTVIAAVAMVMDTGFPGGDVDARGTVAVVALVCGIIATVVAQLFGSAQHLSADGPPDSVTADFAGRLARLHSRRH